MHFTFNKLTLLAILTLSLASCNSSQSSNQENNYNSMLLQDEIAVLETKYNGSYQTFCGVSVFAPLSSTSVTVITIDADVGQVTVYNYLDKGCTKPAVPNQTIMDISVTYPGGTIETRRGVADLVDFTVESVLLDGQEPSLTQQQQLASVGFLEARYDIIALQDSALYTGRNTAIINGSTPEKRPTLLNSQPFIEQ